MVLLLSKGHFYQDNLTSIIDLASYTISVSGKIYSKQIFWQQMDWALQQKSHKAKGPLPLHLSTVYFSHLSYIQDQLRKCIHISKPLIVISSCCRWNKQIINLSSVIKFNLTIFFLTKLKIMICLFHWQQLLIILRGFEICIHFLSWSWI